MARDKPKHRFQKWRNGKIVCACGWESSMSYGAAIAELSHHMMTRRVTNDETT